MKKVILLVVVFSLFVLVGNGMATIVVTSQGTITAMIAADNYGNGDVAISFPTGVTGCENGAWISPNSPGFKTLVAFAMSAYLSQKPVTFALYNDQVWAGSGGHFCKVDQIVLQ